MDRLRNILAEIVADRSVTIGIRGAHSPRLPELEQLLSEIDVLQCFDEYVHLLGTSGSSMSYKRLASYLLFRALQVNTETAIGEIEEYLASETLALEYAFLLPSVWIMSNYQFSNGVRLLKPEAIQDSWLRDELRKQSQLLSVGGHNVDTLLVTPYETTKYYYPNTEPEQRRPLDAVPWPPHPLLDDTRLILSLARDGDFGIPLLASCVIVPKSLSFLERGISWGPYAEPLSHFSPEIIEFEMRSADVRLQQFSALNAETKDRLRIVLKRLNDVKIDSDFVNKYINLRVCLENLFLTEDEMYQISKKLKTRISQHSDLAEAEVENYYKDMSTAVHNGRLPKNSSTPVEKIIQLIKKRILLVLETGTYPNW